MEIPFYAVIGNPIKHSKSPFIHQQFAVQEGVDIIYDYFLLEKPLNQALVDLATRNLLGANVTIPAKEEAYALCSFHTSRAARARAVNTLIATERGWLGDNTDGIGLINDLKRLNVFMDHQNVLILGAGGATRGILPSLIDENPAQIVIANRTASKAQQLADEFSLQAASWDNLPLENHIIINATAASLNGQSLRLPPDIWGHCICAYDLVYRASGTPFLTEADNAGVKMCADGLGMLVEQAAESYFQWRQFKPQTLPILNALRQ